MKCLILFFLLLHSGLVLAQKDTIHLQVKLKPNKMISLYYFDEYLIQNRIRFHNHSKKDSTLFSKIQAKEVIELRYVLITDTFEINYLRSYVNPGDTVKFERNGSKLFGDDNVYPFISDYLDVNEFPKLDGPSEKLAVDRFRINTKVYKNNLKIIDSLQAKGALPDSLINFWKTVSSNFYVSNVREIKKEEAPEYFEEFLEYKKKNITDKKPLNSIDVNNSIHATILAAMMSNGDVNNLTNFITTLTKLNIDRKHKMGIAFEKLKSFPEKSSLAYKEALLYFKDKIADDEFMSSSYGKILSLNVNSINKKALKIETGKRKQATWDDVFVKNKGRYFMVDLWASWCGPCITEIPYFEAMKRKYEGNKIGFVSLNLDVDSKIADWLRLSKQLKITGENYRVLALSNKPFSKSYLISSIPKYLLFDSNGDLVNDDFVVPSSSNFETDLLKYIKN